MAYSSFALYVCVRLYVFQGAVVPKQDQMKPCEMFEVAEHRGTEGM